MTKPLSPAAQAVLDATDYPEDWATRVRVAAALRAASNQLTSAKAMLQLQTIAAELDGTNPSESD